MKIGNFFLVYFFFIILFVGCRHTQNDDKDFSKNVYDINHSVLLSEDKLLDPWDILVFDSVLIIANKNGEPFIETYNIKGHLLQKFLNKGEGPDEVLTVGHLQCLNNHLFVYGLFNKKFMVYNYKNLINAEVIAPDSILNYSFIKNDTSQLINKLYMGERYLIGETAIPEHRIALLDHEGNILKYGGIYPDKVEDQLSDYENAMLYRSVLEYNEKKNKVALFTRSADMIDIFDISERVIETVWSHQGFLPHDLNIIQMGEVYRAAMSDKSQCGYLDAASSEKYIYALYSGRTFGEENYSYGNTIRVMDWTGSSRFELHTDLDINSLTVSSDDRYIYATAIDKDANPLIVVYDIGDFPQ
jgi:hypothetical protein